MFKMTAAQVKQIKEKCKQALESNQITLRELAHIVGVLVATQLAVLPAPIHYRALQSQKNEGILLHSYDMIVTLEEQFEIVVESDASTQDGEHVAGTSGREVSGPRRSYLFTSTAKSISCFAVTCEGHAGCSCQTQGQQHNNDALYQSHGRYTLPPTNEVDYTNLDVVHGQKAVFICLAS